MLVRCPCRDMRDRPRPKLVRFGTDGDFELAFDLVEELIERGMKMPWRAIPPRSITRQDEDHLMRAMQEKAKELVSWHDGEVNRPDKSSRRRVRGSPSAPISSDQVRR